MDAGAFGARLAPRDAYRFAKGEEVMASSGQPAKLARPLDFLVVADHSDAMGFFPQLFAGKPEMLADPTGRRWYDLIQSGRGAEAAIEIIGASRKARSRRQCYCPDSRPYRSAWQETIKAADEANDPGRFTAFIGYEWTSNTGGNNLHRNVIFRDNGMRASLVEPFTTQAPFGSDDPRDLWKWMAAYEEKTGGDVLAIAHNGNLSQRPHVPDDRALHRKADRPRIRRDPGAMGAALRSDADEGRRRDPSRSCRPNDEFANFERWDKGNLDLSEAQETGDAPIRVCPFRAEARPEAGAELGVNPYKFGMIGSTDSHTGLATADEDNYFGKTSAMEPSPERISKAFVKAEKATIYEWETSASGYAAVWATENTREALFDAMERRETYATTGPRMIVRFFGGWDFEPADAVTRSPAVAGYTKGVPMGGDLGPAPGAKRPASWSRR